MILADKIIEERKKNGWSQEELAEKLGVSRQSVSKWESAGSIPDLAKILQMANLFGVSTDYLLKEDMEPEDRIEVVETDALEPLRRVSMEEANAFLDVRKNAAVMIANATSLCIVCPIVLLLLAAFSEERVVPVSEGFAVGIGLTVLFVLVAIAVFMYITTGMKMSATEYLEKELFETEYGVTGMVKELSRAYESTYSTGIAMGVVLCILSVIPVVVLGAADFADHIVVIGVCVLLALIALGVNIMIRVGMIKGSYQTLLQEGDYSCEEKKWKSKLDDFSSAYWCLATAIYLGWSFWTGRWDFTWILWPVAGVLFAAVVGIIRACTNKD